MYSGGAYGAGKVARALQYSVYREYQLGTDSYKTVKLTLNGVNTNKFMLAIVPANSEQSGAVVAKVAENVASEPEKVSDPAVTTGKNTNGYKSEEGIVTTSGANIKTYVGYDLQVNDDANYISGSAPCNRENYYNPKLPFIFKAPDEIIGAEYIPVYKADNGTTIEFNIRRDAKVIAYSFDSSTTVTFDTDTSASAMTKVTDYPVINYMNAATVSGYASDPALFNLLQAFLLNQGADSEDITVSKSELVVDRWCLLSGTVKGATTEYDGSTLYKIGLIKDGAYSAKDSRLYESDGTTAKSVEDILALFTAEPEATAAATLKAAEVVTDLTMNATYSNGTADIRAFDGTDGYNVYADRPGEKPGTLVSYSGVYNIKGAIAIANNMDWVKTEGENENWKSETRYPWYTFKVNVPAEVMIFSSDGTNKYTKELAESETGWIDISGADGTIKLGGSVSQANALAVKKVDAGDTVTFYSPYKSSHYYVIVKPIAE